MARAPYNLLVYRRLKALTHAVSWQQETAVVPWGILAELLSMTQTWPWWEISPLEGTASRSRSHNQVRSGQVIYNLLTASGESGLGRKGTAFLRLWLLADSVRARPSSYNCTGTVGATLQERLYDHMTTSVHNNWQQLLVLISLLHKIVNTCQN